MTTEPLGPAAPPEPPEPERRIAVGPLILVAAGLVAALAFAAIVWALAGSATSSSPSPGPSIAPPAAVAPTPTATAAPRVAGPNECVDARGDGTGIDLDSIGLSADGDDLRIVAVLGDELPEDDATIEVYAESAEVRLQIAAVFSDGEVEEFVVSRLRTDDETDDDSDDGKDDDRGGPHSGQGNGGIDEGERITLKKRDVVVDGTIVVATVGKGVLAELGDSFRWYASATVGAEPADACYAADGTLVPFER